MTDQSLIRKINEATKGSPIFYVTNDAERALGLEKLLENFHIICIDHNDIVDYMLKEGIKIFCLEKELGQKNAIFRNSVKLLKHELTQKYIKDNSQGTGFLATFKISSAFEKETEKLGFKVLNTPAALNRKFENKLSQYESMSSAGVKFPTTVIKELEEADYSSLASDLGEGFVVQFDRGHTGSGTSFIKTKEEFDKLASAFPRRKVRISKKIEGEPFTLNCAVTDKGILSTGLSFQITGVEGLTSQEGGTVGNDFSYPAKLSDDVKKQILAEAEKIGSIMKKDGYFGFFGIDLIVNGRDIFVIEINARQPASVSFFNKLQILNDQTPASLYHFAVFLGIEFDIEAGEYSIENTKPIEAGQVFLRNTENEEFTVGGSVRTGVYRLQSDDMAINWGDKTVKEHTIFLDEDKDKPLVYNGDSYSIDSVKGGFLLLTQSKDKKVNIGNELARIQILQKLVDENGKLLKWVVDSLLAVKTYLR